MRRKVPIIMKKLIIAICCFGLNAFPVHISKKPSSPHARQALTTANFQISISPLEINTSGTKTLDIPGNYYLTDNIEFHPTGAPTANIVIHITSSNVSLDLNAKQISQASANHTPLVRAIVVDPGLSNILIHNGAISNCSGAGIVIASNCENITLHKLSVLSPGLSGIIIGYDPFNTGTYSSVFNGQEQIQYFDPATPPTVFSKDILLDSIYVNGSSGYFSGSLTQYSHAIGIDLAYIENFQIMHSLSNTNTYSAPTLTMNSSINPGGYYVATRSGYMGCGIRMIGCQNGNIENCETSDNAGWTGYGTLMHNCRSINFYMCEADHNVGNGDPVMHMTLLPTSFDFLFHRDIGRAAGFMIQDSSDNHFENCQSHYTLGNRQSYGFCFRRYLMLSSSSSLPSSSYFNPTTIMPQLTATCTPNSSFIDLHNILSIPTLPANPPTIGAGYNVMTIPQYIVNAGSNWNTITHCHATHNVSKYLDGIGFLAQGGINNSFHEILGQSNMSGNGPSTYTPSALADFDVGNGIWSLTEQPKYQNPFTNNLIEYAAGISLESTCLPLMQWNGTTIQIQTNAGNVYFLGTKIKTIGSLSEYALLSWAESYTSVCQSIFKDNYGLCVGTGVGLLLNGAISNIIKQNWFSCNHSCSTGSTASASICADTPSGIGAQGGYGLLDMSSNCTSLIMENFAFGNQIIQPNVVLSCIAGVSTVGLGSYIEGANYYTTYTDGTLSLPLTNSSIGDFSTLSNLLPYGNIEWGPTIKSSCSSVTNCSFLNRTLIASVPNVFTV